MVEIRSNTVEFDVSIFVLSSACAINSSHNKAFGWPSNQTRKSVTNCLNLCAENWANFDSIEIPAINMVNNYMSTYDFGQIYWP